MIEYSVDVTNPESSNGASKRQISFTVCGRNT